MFGLVLSITGLKRVFKNIEVSSVTQFLVKAQPKNCNQFCSCNNQIFLYVYTSDITETDNTTGKLKANFTLLRASFVF